MKPVVICAVPVESRAEKIVGLLKAAGIPSIEVSLLMPDYPAVRDLTQENHNTLPAGAIASCAGVPTSGSLNWLPGLRLVSLAGVGSVIAAGPVVTILTGAGSPPGDIAGGLQMLGIPEYEARQYEAKLRNRNILMAVHSESTDQIGRAEEIFTSAGARDICRSGQQPAQVRK